MKQTRIGQDGFDRPALGLRHLAGRVIGPVAVEADHAPFDAPGHADHAGILADPVIHPVLAPVTDRGHRRAEPARNGSLRPGPVGGFAHPLEVENLQVGVPELALLLGETCADLAERGLAGPVSYTHLTLPTIYSV